MSFDVDAWLNDATPPTRAVKVYGRGDLLAKLQLADALPVPTEEQAPAFAPTLADPTGTGGAKIDPREPARRDLYAELEDSARWLTVRGSLAAERRALAAEFPEDAEGYTTALIAAVLVDPPMTREQVRRLRERIGEGQELQVIEAIRAATDEPVDLGKLLSA